MNSTINKKMLSIAIKETSRLHKKIKSIKNPIQYATNTYGEGVLSVVVFNFLKKSNLEKKLSHEIVRIADKKEAESKDKTISETIVRNRQLKNPHIFYLSSFHSDSASDHKDYQGKIYIDKNWKDVITNETQRKNISKYIKEHDVKDLQWVMGKPVWFVTRPNCRHYFKDLGVSDVLNTSVSRLLTENDMRTAIGDRSYLQVIKHATSKKWYDDIRNAELLLEQYRERLALHKKMWEENPNTMLKNAIKKDMLLVQKWQNYILNKKSA